MSEEKDVAQVEAEMKALEERGGDSHNGVGPKGASGGDAVPPQLHARPRACPSARASGAARSGSCACCTSSTSETAGAIRKSLPEDLLAQADSGAFEPHPGRGGRHWAPEADADGGRAAAPPRCPVGGRGVTATDKPKAPGLLDGKFSPTRAARRQRQPLRLRLDTMRALPKRPFQMPRVHPAGLVHRQRHDPADGAGLDPVRRGHRAAARHPDPPARRAVVHRRRRACSPSSARPARSSPRC